MDKTPKNQEGQPPTDTPEKTAARLREKERGQMGAANKERTEERIEDASRR